MKPTIDKGVASQYASPTENIYDVGDGQSGGLISVSRIAEGVSFIAPGALVISAYRLDPDVKVQAPAEQLLVTDAVIMTAQRVMELTSTALSNVQMQALQAKLFADTEFAELLMRVVDDTVRETR